MPLARPPSAPTIDKTRLSITCALGASLAFSVNDITVKSFSGSFPLHEVVLIRALVAQPPEQVCRHAPGASSAIGGYLISQAYRNSAAALIAGKPPRAGYPAAAPAKCRMLPVLRPMAHQRSTA